MLSNGCLCFVFTTYMHTFTMLLPCPTYSPLVAMAFQSIVDVAGTALFLAASGLSVYSGALLGLQ